MQQKKEAERSRNLSIFDELLAMAPEDEVANFGRGKICLEDHKIDEAMAHLEAVIRVNPKHSLAYELLGRALLARGDAVGATEILNQGVVVAKENGDLMPLKSMQQVLRSMVEKQAPEGE
jgi:predicted Zn-dependent protease